MENKDIKLQPVISEKSYNAANADNKYTFLADRSLNKIIVTKAIESKYKVSVIKVNSVVRPGKGFKNWKTNKSFRKTDKVKFVVTLKKGDKIDEFLSK